MNMNRNRWYPTCTMLPDGRVLAIGGSTCNANPSLAETTIEFVPEVFDPATGTWELLEWAEFPQAFQTPPGQFPGGLGWYPQMSVLPSGKLLFPGPQAQSWLLDLNNQQQPWTQVGQSTGVMDRMSSVTYAPGKVLKCGSGFCDEASHVTWLIDLSDPQATTAQWQIGPLLTVGRKDHNLVLLPDGKIVAIGGRSFCTTENCNNSCDPVLETEWIDPDGDLLPVQWRQWRDMTIPRGYHSTAVLLPDGSVLTAGGENHFGTTPPPAGYHSSRSAERFLPPYLFAADGSFAPRPVIASAPQEVGYDRSFTVQLNPAGVQVIEKVSLIRLAAVTHGFDQNQRFLWLNPASEQVPFEQQTNGELQIKTPGNPNLAPPGYYLLFALTRNSGTGHLVPSEARYVRLFLPPCGQADLNDDCTVNGIDLGILLANWSEPPGSPGCGGQQPCESDLNGDGVVDGIDLGILLANWGPCECAESGGSMMMGGGESLAMLPTGSGYDYDWDIDPQTAEELPQMDITALWAWYWSMLAQSGAAEQ